MEQFENLLTHLATEWDGALLIMGDFNIYLLDRHLAVVVQYKNMLDSYSLHQHVQVPTCITSKSSMLIDHTVSNVPNRVTYTNVLLCPTVSDHDAPYVCRNVHVNVYTGHASSSSEVKRNLMNKNLLRIFQNFP